MEFAFDNLLEAILVAVGAILAFLAGNGIVLLRAYMTGKIGAEKYMQLRDFASDVVHALQQSPLWRDMLGSEKFERAKLWILEYAEANNIPVDEHQLEIMIEAAVSVMKAVVTEVVPPLEGDE